MAMLVTSLSRQRMSCHVLFGHGYIHQIHQQFVHARFLLALYQLRPLESGDTQTFTQRYHLKIDMARMDLEISGGQGRWCGNVSSQVKVKCTEAIVWTSPQSWKTNLRIVLTKSVGTSWHV